MRESAIETMVNDWAKSNGIFTLKNHGSGVRGKSDRIYAKNGKAIFVELKATGKRPTSLQEKFIAERRADGFPADWFDAPAPAIQFIKTQLLHA